jgi:hypothetical protein
LYTNRVSTLINTGTTAIVAAVNSVKLLATVELICVAGGIIAVLFLPQIYNKKGEKI